MQLNKLSIGLGVAVLVLMTAAIPAYAAEMPDSVKVEGAVQSIDMVAGTFTILAEDGSLVTVDSPDGFDLALLVVGNHVEVQGTAGPDDVINAGEIELQDGTEVEVEDETEDIDDDDLDEVEDESQDDVDDDDADEVEDHDEDSGDDHAGDSDHFGSDHDEDSSHSDDSD